MPIRSSKSESRKKRTKGIESTGSSAVSRRQSGIVTISLRLPVSMLKEVDAAVKQRPYRMPRHMWLLEAVHEKLIRLRSGSKQQGQR